VVIVKRILFVLQIIFIFNSCLLNPVVNGAVLSNETDKNSFLRSVFGYLLQRPIRTIKLNKDSSVIQRLGTDQLTASLTVDGNPTTTSFVWTSSNTSVATVSENGLVTSVGTGLATITVREMGGSAFAVCAIHVYSGYVYTSLNFNTAVGRLTMNTSSGLLTFNSTIGTVGTDPTGIAVDPFGRFAYTGDFNGGNISQFKIDASTGALTANGSITTGGLPRNITISPDAKFLYLANQGLTSVQSFAINQSTGALTLIDSFSVGSALANLTMEPTGKYLFVRNSTGTSLLSILLDSSGSLTLASTSPTVSPIGTLATDPYGRYVFIASGLPNSISTMKLNRENGNLALIGTLDLPTLPNGIVVHPNGRFLYSANLSDQTISTISITPDSGALSLIATTSPRGGSVRYIVIDPTGRFAYLADNAGSLQQYSIDQNTGVLTWLGDVNPGGNQWNLYLF
jgi:6-phosphogluconolactonase (cycloisomerase 2 family)